MSAALPELPVRAQPLQRSRLASRLRRVIKGQVLFDAFNRGRYATDASIHQVRPLGAVVPADEHDLQAAVEIAAELRVPMISRGAGSSVCGQSVGEALIIDCSRLDRVHAIDTAAMRAEVEPGVVLDRLNALLKPQGLWFPVDISSSAVATIGGMAGNNAAGPRSIVYGSMVHNVQAIDAVLADGYGEHFGEFGVNAVRPLSRGRSAELVSRLFMIGARERDEIERRWPTLERRAGGYNLDIFHPRSKRPYTRDGSVNLSHLLVGSEGTLAHFRRIHLKLARRPEVRVLGVINFPTLTQALSCTAAIAAMRPATVELVDRAIFDAVGEDPVFRPVIDAVRIVRQGQPTVARLLIEFAGDAGEPLLGRLRDLATLMADLGLPDAVVPVCVEGLQRALWRVYRVGLDRLMRPGANGRPVYFIEDCVVPLEHLPEYAARLDEILRRHGTRAIWYGQAAAGALHVRPILDLQADGGSRMRAIAEETAVLVERFNGVLCGAHGAGLTRSEWVGRQFGPRLVRAFEEVKDLFDPHALMNPGKIVRASRLDRPDSLRHGPAQRAEHLRTALDWPAGNMAVAADRCDGNGRCRSLDAGVMCPSFRALREEQHLPRGRANTLRLALTGQLGAEALVSDELFETLATCVGCKACRSECPQGIDVSRMKIEFLHHYRERHGLPLRERLIASLPSYAPVAARVASVLNGLSAMPGSAWLRERLLGLAADRSLPRWSSMPFTRDRSSCPPGTLSEPDDRTVLLWADTFNNHFEPEVLRAARRVLEAAGKTVVVAPARPDDPEPARPLCCGRTWLAAGQVDRARAELTRTLDALTAPACASLPLVGLEPACLFTFRDEASALGLGERAADLAARAVMFEEYLAVERAAGRLELPLRDQTGVDVHVHGHCHQKAFGTADRAVAALKLLPGATVHPIASGCCGMAGAFGFQAETRSASRAMAALDLLPSLAALPQDALVVADGSSCRHLIREDAGRTVRHVAQILDRALAGRVDDRSDGRSEGRTRP
jgi:FAD/FMN-containing dehydrogenase/Fe-S oxidoreductase